MHIHFARWLPESVAILVNLISVDLLYLAANSQEQKRLLNEAIAERTKCETCKAFSLFLVALWNSVKNTMANL